MKAASEYTQPYRTSAIGQKRTYAENRLMSDLSHNTLL